MHSDKWYQTPGLVRCRCIPADDLREYRKREKYCTLDIHEVLPDTDDSVFDLLWDFTLQIAVL
jgi:hypothetical protein